MYRLQLTVLVLLLSLLFSSCNRFSESAAKLVRPQVDTIGFAQYDWQMDSIMNRITKQNITKNVNFYPDAVYKNAICPHDDYAYAGHLYKEVLKGIKAKTVIIFGVAHKAAKFNLENQIIFDSFTHWHGPYGDIKVSSLREKIMQKLPTDMYQVNDSMQAVEHSVEAMLPFLQYYNRDVEFVSILVPYMPYERVAEISKKMAYAVKQIMDEDKLEWGKDFAFLISSDAVHYGDEGWGGKNFAEFGVDSSGYYRAIAREKAIVKECLIGDTHGVSVRKFMNFTIDDNDYKKYKWTWCGRYSIPMGIFTAYYLKNYLRTTTNGQFIGYATSIDHPTLKVDDLKMGTTAPASLHHWVGYLAIGYK